MHEGQGKHAGVEQRVIGEECDMASTFPARQQHGRCEAARDAECRQPGRLLQDRQQAGERRKGN